MLKILDDLFLLLIWNAGGKRYIEGRTIKYKVIEINDLKNYQPTQIIKDANLGNSLSGKCSLERMPQI